MTKAITPLVSVVIPTLNEEHYIARLLTGIVSQNFNVEVIVSDNGSVDKTKEIVEEFIEKYPSHIKFVSSLKKGPSCARNFGATHARGEYVVFLDADSQIPSDFFSKIYTEVKNRKLAGAGLYLKPNSKKLIDKIILLVHNSNSKLLQWTKHPAATGAGIIVRKDMHDKICGFDESIFFAEDLFYLRDISLHGKFRMVRSTYIIYSVRRFEKEGRLKLWLKYSIGGLCYLFNIRKTNIEYEFGHFTEKSSTEKLND